VTTQDHVGKQIIGLVKNGNMIKLTDIVDEIKVRPPLNPLEIVNNLGEFFPFLLIQVSEYGNLIRFKEGHGFPDSDLEDILSDEYGFQGEELNKATKLVEDYYQNINAGDVKVIQYTDGKIDVSGYKSAITKYEFDTSDCYYTILTKF
jgi:hypothetical protein